MLMQRKMDKEKMVGEWVKAVNELVGQVERWSESFGWATSRQKKTIRERALGAYEVDDLVIKTTSGVLVLEVRGRDVIDAEGRVDLYALENLNRLILVRKDGRWVLKTDTGVRWPKVWGRSAFGELPEMVASAA